MLSTIILIVALSVGAWFVLRGTSLRNRWGVNFSSLKCAHCRTPSRQGVHWPKSFHQLLWGGWTCSVCGTLNDKWGRRIGPPNELQSDSQNHIDQAG